MNRKLTRYEKTRILGARALQISQGAPVMTDIGDLTDFAEIARKELKEGVIPLKIRRKLPNGETREFSITELQNN